MRRVPAVAVLLLVVTSSCTQPQRSGEITDEARQAGRAAASLASAGEDYFHDMDGGLALTADEIKGRNTWMVWTGGSTLR